MSNLISVGLLLIGISVLVGLVIVAVMWRAWWLYPAWGWFVVPLGAPQIRFWHFAALMLFISVLTNHTDTKKDERKEDWGKLAVILIGPPLTWALLRWMR